MTYNKYGNRKTEVDGFIFDSKREANRYQELKLWERSGEISRLELQPAFDLLVMGGKSVGKYIADFRYLKDGKEVIEDVKGMKTDIYRLKKKIVEAVYGFKIVEV
jgi:Protein of unknown function (DUF1064)